MATRQRRPSALCAGLVLMLLATAACAADDDPITPYRPSVSSPAQLPATGQLELELGGLRQRSADATRDSLPWLMKLAFSKEWGVLIGGEAYVGQRDDSGSAHGFGDTTIVLKRAWGIDDATALGAELSVKTPTAKDSIGSGKADYGLNTILSRDFGPVHMDANLNVLQLGAVDPGTARTQYGASASFSTRINEQWAVTGELSGTRRSGIDHTGQVLGAVTYSPTKRLTFDMGIARAAHPVPGLTQYFAGVVFPLGHLF